MDNKDNSASAKNSPYLSLNLTIFGMPSRKAIYFVMSVVSVILFSTMFVNFSLNSVYGLFFFFSCVAGVFFLVFRLTYLLYQNDHLLVNSFLHYFGKSRNCLFG